MATVDSSGKTHVSLSEAASGYAAKHTASRDVSGNIVGQSKGSKYARAVEAGITDDTVSSGVIDNTGGVATQLESRGIYEDEEDDGKARVSLSEAAGGYAAKHTASRDAKGAVVGQSAGSKYTQAQENVAETPTNESVTDKIAVGATGGTVVVRQDVKLGYTALERETLNDMAYGGLAGYTPEQRVAITEGRRKLADSAAKLADARTLDDQLSDWSGQYESEKSKVDTSQVTQKIVTWTGKAKSVLSNATDIAAVDIPLTAVGNLIGGAGAVAEHIDVAIKSKGASISPDLKSAAVGTVATPFAVAEASMDISGTRGGISDINRASIQTIADVAVAALVFKYTPRVVGATMKETGRGLGIVRDKTVLIKNQPYHPVGSQGAMIDAVTQSDVISGARATSAHYLYREVYGSPIGVKTFEVAGKKYTAGSTVNKLLGRDTHVLTRFEETGRVLTRGYTSPVHASYMVPDLTKGAYEQVGIHFLDKHGVPRFKQEIQIIENVPTVASELKPWHRTAIAEYGKTGRIDSVAFQDIQRLASEKSARINQPVATLTPKTGSGFYKPELETFLVYGSEKSTAITSSKLVGFTEHGVKIRKIGFGEQTPVKSGNWVVENARYNWKNRLTGGGEYAKGMAEFENRKIAEIQGTKLSKPNQYGKHGPAHTEPVVEEITKLWKASPELQRKYSLEEFKVAADLHDSARIYGTSRAGETEPLAHGPAMAKSIRMGLIEDSRLNALPRSAQLRVADAIETHMTIKPLSTHHPFAGIKTALSRPSDFQKSLATADRLARANEAGYLKPGMIFDLPEQTTSFKLKQSISRMTPETRSLIADTSGELFPSRSLKTRTNELRASVPEKLTTRQKRVRDIDVDDGYGYGTPKKRSTSRSAYALISGAKRPSALPYRPTPVKNTLRITIVDAYTKTPSTKRSTTAIGKSYGASPSSSGRYAIADVNPPAPLAVTTYTPGAPASVVPYAAPVYPPSTYPIASKIPGKYTTPIPPGVSKKSRKTITARSSDILKSSKQPEVKYGKRKKGMKNVFGSFDQYNRAMSKVQSSGKLKTKFKW